MELRDISFSTPCENILFDDVLLDLAEKNEGVSFLRFWESPQVFIVLGLIGKGPGDIHAMAQKDKIPVLRRSSGGGTVLQGPGCLNYTLVLPKKGTPSLQDLKQSYQWISAKMITALQKCGVEAYFRPPSDLAIGPHEKKFSGNAQRRKKNCILHHGTILYNFNLSLMGRYLNMPSEIPAYRQGRSHGDFVTNIALDVALFKNRLAEIFEARPTNVRHEELAWLKGAMDKLKKR